MVTRWTSNTVSQRSELNWTDYVTKKDSRQTQGTHFKTERFSVTARAPPMHAFIRPELGWGAALRNDSCVLICFS